MAEGMQTPKKVRSVLGMKRFMVPLPWILIAGYVLRVVYYVFNPQDVNRIVLINRDPTAPQPVYPITVSLDSKAGHMERTYDGGRLSGDNGLDTFIWPYAYFRGDFQVVDNTGRVLARFELLPIARFSGNLVVVIEHGGQVRHDFNQLPLSE
ncbi:MAG: hypothetical protein JNL58_31355 [Planctomyces sp.]|nr:hypothetical protein [Planctomyces sp.]